MRVFFDTNILLDVLLNRSEFVADSAAIILRCEAMGAEMFVAWHGVATAYYLLKRGRTGQEALVEVDRILAWARVADATDSAARRGRALGFSDFEDALQAAQPRLAAPIISLPETSQTSLGATSSHCLPSNSWSDFRDACAPFSA